VTDENFNTIPLATFRAILNELAQLPSGAEVAVEVRGIVIQNRAWGRMLWDITGQGVIEPAEKSPNCDPSRLQVRRVAIVKGKARLNRAKEGVVIRPTEIRIIPKDPLQHADITAPDSPVPRRVLASFLLARVRELASATALNLGYREFEPRYITTPSARPHAEPLSVSFPGWGAPEQLATSPAAQLLQILLQTGETHVFAVAHCFSSAYRDGFSSAEKLALVARQLDTTLAMQSDFAESIVRAVLQDRETAGMSTSDFGGDWARTQLRDPADKKVDRPEVQICPPPKHATQRDVFRIVIPPGVVVAEGDVGESLGDIRVGGSIIHLERLVYVLSPHRLSEIRNLSAGEQHGGRML